MLVNHIMIDFVKKYSIFKENYKFEMKFIKFTTKLKILILLSILSFFKYKFIISESICSLINYS